jgi:hypothetical protein
VTTDEHHDSPRQFRADLTVTFQEYGITDRGAAERAHLSKSTVSRLHTPGDALPNWGHVERVLRAYPVPERVIEELRRRHVAMATVSADPVVSADSWADDAVEDRDEDAVNAAAEGERRWSGRTRLVWGVIALLAITAVIAVAVVSTSGSTNADPTAVIVVRNKVAIGASKLVLDPSGPAYLSTETRPHCDDNECKVPDSDLEPGQELIATCEAHSTAPMRNYNESDPDPHAERNPHRLASTLWYRASTKDGKYTGLISAIYLDPADHNGHGLPACPA